MFTKRTFHIETDLSAADLLSEYCSCKEDQYSPCCCVFEDVWGYFSEEGANLPTVVFSDRVQHSHSLMKPITKKG